MGSVYYKFKSQKEPSRVTFDGTGISVFDLKREIMIANKMGKGEDFDLAIYNQSNNEGESTKTKMTSNWSLTKEIEFVEDTDIIPRSTSVIVRRIPASKPGKGTAQKYVGSGGPMSTGSWSTSGGPRRDHAKTATFALHSNSNLPKTTPVSAPVSVTGSDQDAISQMFRQSTEQWEQTQEELANHEYKGQRPGMGKSRLPVPERPPPQGYVCYRCGQKGHWIQGCPTNGDTEWDGRPRIKKTTGIPRSFLKTVEQPKGTAETSSNSAVMVTPQGGFVIATPDSASWDAYKAKSKKVESSDVYDSKPNEIELECPICQKLIKEGVKPPCCLKVYCEDCLTDHLTQHDYTCPNCKTKNVSLDSLIADYDIRDKVDEYVKSVVNAGELPIASEKNGENSKVSTPKTNNDVEISASPLTNSISKATTPVPLTINNGPSKPVVPAVPTPRKSTADFYHDKDRAEDDTPGALDYGGATAIKKKIDDGNNSNGNGTSNNEDGHNYNGMKNDGYNVNGIMNDHLNGMMNTGDGMTNEMGTLPMLIPLPPANVQWGGMMPQNMMMPPMMMQPTIPFPMMDPYMMSSAPPIPPSMPMMGGYNTGWNMPPCGGYPQENNNLRYREGAYAGQPTRQRATKRPRPTDFVEVGEHANKR